MKHHKTLRNVTSLPFSLANWISTEEVLPGANPIHWARSWCNWRNPSSFVLGLLVWGQKKERNPNTNKQKNPCLATSASWLDQQPPSQSEAGSDLSGLLWQVPLGWPGPAYNAEGCKMHSLCRHLLHSQGSWQHRSLAKTLLVCMVLSKVT